MVMGWLSCCECLCGGMSAWGSSSWEETPSSATDEEFSNLHCCLYLGSCSLIGDLRPPFFSPEWHNLNILWRSRW
jgi:hypothetical protein